MITNVRDNQAVKQFTINIEDWTQNAETELYEAIIQDATVTTNDMANIAVDSTTYSVAEEAGIKAYTEEQEEAIKLFADNKPTGVITGKYTVNRGVANG